jgi:uncharacterized NAD-dependent epimerase/dehydratase family protein
MDWPREQPFVVFTHAAKSCHRASHQRGPGVDFERFRELERLRTETDVDGVFANNEVLQSQARELVGP